jgi:hypothetical protein
MSTPLYAAKCFWPGVTERALARAAAVAATAAHAGYRGSLLFPEDELALCLFDAATRAAVRRTTERAGIPCERVMKSLWLPHPSQKEDTAP